jgi:dTMP kinase
VDFYKKVREGYLLLAKNMPDRVILVDGTHSTAAIAQTIWEHVKIRLG